MGVLRCSDLSDEQLLDGEATVVVDGLSERDEVDGGEEGISEAEGEHGGDVSTSILCSAVGRKWARRW